MADATNRLLDGVPQRERQRILHRSEAVELTFATVLSEQRAPYEHAHFPLSGHISLVARVDGHPPMELAMIGNEGVLGASLVLGVTEAPQQAVVQGDGTALKIGAIALQDVLADCPVLLHSVSRYLFEQMIQLAQNTVCTRFHPVEERLARWLLMTHDRTPDGDLELTHQILANMLGVQRSAVTIASGTLRHRRLIDYSRGEIRVLDRAGLEQAACGCYEAAAR